MDNLPQSRKDQFPFAPLSDYGISVERGFLPAYDPLLSLPSEYQAWDDAGAKLPKLLVAGHTHVRKMVSSLPVLDICNLTTIPQKERAMIILSYLAHAYVFCDADGAGVSPGVINSLPACIAAPLFKLSKTLGRPPVLQFATFAQNWQLLDKSKPVELGNIVMIQNFYGGVDEEWFFLVPIVMEVKGGDIVNAIVTAQQAIYNNDTNTVTTQLQLLSGYITVIMDLLQRMREWCNPTIFYTRLRPFLHGWSNLSNGLLFEGVDELHNTPQKQAGGSAAQTPLVQVIDAALGISSQPFLKEMRKYMQPYHAKFLAEVEEISTIRQHVVANSKNSDLVAAYNCCVEKIADFRSYHIQLAASYILSQQGNNKAARGTGGQNFVDFLKKTRDNTLAHCVANAPTN